MKPLASWTRDLIQRVDQLEKWSETAHPPTIFWMSGFTFPTGFLTAVLQTSARLYNVCLPFKYNIGCFILFITDLRTLDFRGFSIMGVHSNASRRSIFDLASKRRSICERSVPRGCRLGQKSQLPNRTRTHAIGLSNAHYFIQASGKQKESH